MISSSEQRQKIEQMHLEISNYENASAINRNGNNEEDVIENSSNNGRIESFHSQQQQQFIHHALSSTNNRHRRSLKNDISSIDRNSNGRYKNNFKRHLIKRYIVKRNFPNNQLSKSSDEMEVVDESNELETGGPDETENEDEYDENEEEKKSKGQQQPHDRLEEVEEEEDNENDLEKSIKMYVPYWDAYDTVNQLFLEMSEYYLHSQFMAELPLLTITRLVSA